MCLRGAATSSLAPHAIVATSLPTASCSSSDKPSPLLAKLLRAYVAGKRRGVAEPPILHNRSAGNITSRAGTNERLLGSMTGTAVRVTQPQNIEGGMMSSLTMRSVHSPRTLCQSNEFPSSRWLRRTLDTLDASVPYRTVECENEGKTSRR